MSEAWKVKRIGVAPDGDKEKKNIPAARTEMIIKKKIVLIQGRETGFHE